MKSIEETSPETWQLPSKIPYLLDGELAFELLESLRPPIQGVCPRCGSQVVLKMNTSSYRDLYRCGECKYMYNALAGTIFQHSKMPMNKFFQFFVLQEALAPDITVQEVSFALGFTYKTALLWLRRGRLKRKYSKFARRDEKFAMNQLGAELGSLPKDPFFSFSLIKGIVVNDRLLRKYIAAALTTEVKAS